MEKIKYIGWESESTPVQIRKWGVMIENKINEIIDRLNEQPVVKKSLTTEKPIEDTPEEWEEEIRGLLWRMKYSNTEDYYEKKYVEELISKVKQLLEERTFTRSELSNLKDWIDNEYVPSMEARDVIDERIIKKVNRLLSKLNSEEK